MWKRSSRRLAAVLAISTAAIGPAPLAQTACPTVPVPNISSPAVPTDVCIPDGFADNPILYFDDYSWRAFIAMVWPALNGQRGTPDPAKGLGSTGPLVFETFKSIPEVFHSDASAPSAWNAFDPPQYNPCNAAESFQDITLAAFSKFADVGQAGFGSLVGPLVAQNGTFVRYLTGFNETEFDQIAQSSWYQRSKLPASITFQTGSLDVKSSWVDMTNVPHPERYYTRMAWVMDPYTGNCSQKTVGLVGLHIVQKTPSRPQWIWSTFEQVDNVPPLQPGASGSLFNDGSGTPMPSSNPYALNPLPAQPVTPYNVNRIVPVNTSTLATNTAYRALLAGKGPWQFYRLIATQWPLQASQPGVIATPQNTFPGAKDTSAFANTTMETFDQASVFTGCMSCHAATQVATDLVWALEDHAQPENVPSFLLGNPQFKKLQLLLKQSRIPPEAARDAAAHARAKSSKK